MTFQVIVGPIVKEDLSRNANWWADNHSVDQAVKWIDAVELQLRDLALNPERFGYAPENGLFTIERADLQLDVRLKDVLVNRIGLGTSA